MPAIGIPSERFLRDKNTYENVRNDVSRFVSGIWSTFGFFACAIGAFTLIISLVYPDSIRLLAAVLGLIAELVLLFGLAECITGVALKNWAIKIAGFVTGVGGLAIYYIAGSGWEPMCRLGLGTDAHFHLRRLGADCHGLDCQNSIQIGYVSET